MLEESWAAFQQEAAHGSGSVITLDGYTVTIHELSEYSSPMPLLIRAIRLRCLLAIRASGSDAFLSVSLQLLWLARRHSPETGWQWKSSQDTTVIKG